MRAVVASAALLAACAARSPPEPAAAAAPGSPGVREPSAPYAGLAERLEGVDLEGLTVTWPRRNALPRPEKCYGTVFSVRNPAKCDGWSYDVLLDLECPRVVWVRASGTIAGIVEYRGPAALVNDSGPLEFRVGD